MERTTRVGLLGRFGVTRTLAQARAAELRGELAEAATLYARAGRLDETARVMILRGDGETDPAARLKHYVQAASTAPDGSTQRLQARRKRATHLLAIGESAPMTATLRQDLLEAARDLETAGDNEKAAQAYARVGDVEGEARNLARAGDIEKLDDLLHVQQGREREALAQRDARQRMAMLTASGRRREALAIGRASTDAALRDRARLLEESRVDGGVVRLVLRGLPLQIVLGDEVTVGRVAAISIASAAVSRHHVTVARRGTDVVVRDLGSRNGTRLRGLALAGEVFVADGVELRLGDEVPMMVRPSGDPCDGVAIEVGGARYFAPLGAARLGVGAWRLERGDDGWVELVTDESPPAYAAGLTMAGRVTLLSGDALGTARDGEAVVRVEP
jgi:hypothetical protein